MVPQKIACVVVFYNPDTDALENVKRLASCGYSVVVVVNQASEDTLRELQMLKDVYPIVNDTNLGLASALNQGVTLAFDQLNVDYVTLFDQDSQPERALPISLALELEEYSSNAIACIGPMLEDRKDPTATYAQNDLEFSGIMPASIPTSGTLIPLNAWRDIGPMMDSLFIDGIDHEWCLRAKHRGYQVRLSRTVTMVHDMGDANIKVFGRYKPIHRSPIRHYFIVRNTLFLASLNYLPIKWRLLELTKTIRRIAVYLFVSSDRPMSLRLICHAIVDGIRRRLGPCKVI
jgi:rhamnosyltransferase